MKKLVLFALVLAVVAMTGCEGDDPQSPGGTLTTVTGLTVDEAASGGTSVVLTWTAVSDDIDGYEIYCREDGGSWSVAGTSTTTTFTDDADAAYEYSVRAYNGDNYSENYATAVDVFPNIITTEYTIYDNYAPADYHSGIYFDFNGATTGFASSTSFSQDIYAYDESKGDNDVWFYSGDYGTFGNGNTTWMYAAGGTYGYCPEGGGSGWWTHGELYASDDVIFGYLQDGYYIKMYIDDIFAEPISQNGTGVTLHYEIQPIQGLRLFTTDSN